MGYMYDAGGNAASELNRTSSTGAKVLGGEACMWGETVDPSDLESTVWPRAAAVAEQLWSPSEVTANGFVAAKGRLESFRCLLLQRGVRSGLVSGNGREVPPGPGSCSQSSAMLSKTKS